MMTNSVFSFCLQIWSLTHAFCSNQSVLRGFKRSCFSKKNVNKMWLFGEKTDGFAKKRPDRPRLVSPESSHPKLDTPFVVIWSSFFTEKTHKIDKLNDFLILCDHQLFQQYHVRFTFEDHHVLQKAHQTSD